MLPPTRARALAAGGLVLGGAERPMPRDPTPMLSHVVRVRPPPAYGRGRGALPCRGMDRTPRVLQEACGGAASPARAAPAAGAVGIRLIPAACHPVCATHRRQWMVDAPQIGPHESLHAMPPRTARTPSAQVSRCSDTTGGATAIAPTPSRSVWRVPRWTAAAVGSRPPHFGQGRLLLLLFRRHA